MIDVLVVVIWPRHDEEPHVEHGRSDGGKAFYLDTDDEIAYVTESPQSWQTIATHWMPWPELPQDESN